MVWITLLLVMTSAVVTVVLLTVTLLSANVTVGSVPCGLPNFRSSVHGSVHKIFSTRDDMELWHACPSPACKTLLCSDAGRLRGC